jgi:hypothetical protein
VPYGSAPPALALLLIAPYGEINLHIIYNHIEAGECVVNIVIAIAVALIY